LTDRHPYRLPRHEIVRKKKLISLLFTGGMSLKCNFLRMVYLSHNDVRGGFSSPLSVMFAVSKKTLPSAVMRNRAKRLMREAYRIEKPLLQKRIEELQGKEKAGEISIVFLYTQRGSHIPPLTDFRLEMNSALRQMLLGTGRRKV
jgi:ribonuclease P protein component